MFRLVSVLVIAAITAFIVFSVPDRLHPAAFNGLTGDSQRGERLFWAGGCATCHAAPGAEGEARLVMAGGRTFDTDFGLFYAPNISSDPRHGIGSWGPLDLANALTLGTSPAGRHYYPAFPYVSYADLSHQEVVDLWAYLRTLPASSKQNRDHRLRFPFSVRRLLWIWKAMFMDGRPDALPGLSPEAE